MRGPKVLAPFGMFCALCAFLTEHPRLNAQDISVRPGINQPFQHPNVEEFIQRFEIDFHRVEGKSSDWVLEHVRAGQEVFTREIESAGFKQVEQNADLLKESYLVRFEKVAVAQETSAQFRRLDRNGDGKLTRDEFSAPLFDQLDANKDGVVTAEEDRQFVQRRAGVPGAAPRIPDSIRAELDVPYAANDNPRQRLDLYLPKNPKSDGPLPVVAFIHGGAWQAGDKRGGLGTVAPLVESGEYAGVSIGYRLSSEAIWPAQIHDCKAALRWLRANAQKYNLDPDRIGVTGPSAGGHLVAMLGTSGDVADLEGNLGDHTNVSSRVSCVVDQFGPTELLKMGGSHNGPNSPESKLVGGPIQEHQDATRKASPTTYVSKDDPPFLLIHGTDDRTVPFSQSELLEAVLKQAGVPVVLVPVTGGGHGNFGTPEVGRRMKQFFDKHLLKTDVVVSTEPIKAGPDSRPN